MKQHVTLPRLVLLGLLAAAASATSVAAQSGDEPAKFAVVDVDGEIRVIGAAEVETLKAELKQEFKDATEAHKAAKKEAKANKEKFTEPAPKQKKLKVVKPSLDREEADKLANELRAKGDEKAKKKGGKPKKG